VWTDFPGAFLFEGGFANVSAHDGFYGHISMMNSNAGQLTEFIPVARMFAAVWQFYARNATAYGMINLSDLKYVPLTAEAIYRYLWSPASFNATPACAARTAAAPARDAAGRRAHTGAWPLPRAGAAGCTAADFGRVTPAAAADAFVAEFSTRHYGTGAGASAAALYAAYFNISYMANAVPGVATLADHYLGSQLRTLVSTFEKAVNAKDPSNSDLKTVAAKVAAFAAANLPALEALYHGGVVPLGASLPAGTAAANFFAAHLGAQAAIHWAHVAAFGATAAGAAAFARGDAAGAAAGVATSLAAFDELGAALRAAEGPGTWAGSCASPARAAPRHVRPHQSP
jgi:hypothetical protein